MDLGLQGRIALVTGSWRGTGAVTAEVLAAEGASVIVHGFDLAPAEAVARRIRDAGGDAQAVAGDLLSDVAVAAMREQTGPVDILVNNYGVADRGAWFDEGTGEDAWFEAYNRNVMQGIRMVRRYTPDMLDRGWGRVVFLGTMGSARPAARNPHYYAAKGALPAVVVSLAKEVLGSGVTVNLVSPGLISTAEIVERFTSRAARHGRSTEWPDVQREILQEFTGQTRGRIAEPAEVAKLVAYVASELGGSIHGANLRIDGGAADTVTP